MTRADGAWAKYPALCFSGGSALLRPRNRFLQTPLSLPSVCQNDSCSTSLFCLTPPPPFQSQGLYFLLFLTSSICEGRLTTVKPARRQSQYQATVSSLFRCKIYNSITASKGSHTSGRRRFDESLKLDPPGGASFPRPVSPPASWRVVKFSTSFTSSILKPTALYYESFWS